MKTITEFSGIILRQAAEALRAHRAANPPPSKPEEPASPQNTGAHAVEENSPLPSSEATASDNVTADDNPDAISASDVENTSSAAADETPSAVDAPATSAVDAPATDDLAPPAEVNLGEGPEAQAVGVAMGLEGDRLTRLMEALDVAGKRVGQVRLVRVVASDNAPEGAQKRGEFYFIVDHMPRQFNRQETDQGRGGRGDDRRRDSSRGGGGRPNNEGGRNKVTGGKFAGGFAPREEMGAKGDVPRAGAGWMLTRAPEERRAAPDHRRGARPAQEPRKDFRGNRSEGGRGAGPRPDGRTGNRDARGPRPQGPRPPQDGRPPQGPKPAGTNFRPNRPNGGADRGRDQRHEGGRGPRPQPRRGGWDEPLVVEPVTTPVPQNPTEAAPPLSAAVEPKVSTPTDGNT